MHRMGVMALLIPPESGLDTAKCVRMAIVHDLGECIAGDITPNDNVSDEDKFKMEKDAFDQLIRHLSPASGMLCSLSLSLSLSLSFFLSFSLSLSFPYILGCIQTGFRRYKQRHDTHTMHMI
eukprot:TRINITY_DN4530_c0_g1_i3.p1 TRINITY_DN4530_c0_g1~~TRINITY_DN4530_c0_g1_i3.p1  ORF type:complete len:122 (-),score=22.12 TRINITY_DN4530_c0_g1_i3:61-426(-)